MRLFVRTTGGEGLLKGENEMEGGSQGANLNWIDPDIMNFG